MKVAVPSIGNSLSSEASNVFRRCPYFVIVNIENGEVKGDLTIDNPARNDPKAGTKAATFIAKNN